MVGALCKLGTKEIFGLKCYFWLENFGDRRYKRLQTSFNNSILKFNYYFTKLCCHCFTSFNKLLHHEEPLIHKPYDCQQRFMSKLTARFIKPFIIQNHKDLGNSFSTLYSDYQDQRKDIELGIGIIT